MEKSNTESMNKVCDHIKHINPIEHPEVEELWVKCGYLSESSRSIRSKKEEIKKVLDEEFKDLKKGSKKSISSTLKSIASGLTAGIAIAIYTPLQNWIDSWFGGMPNWLSTLLTIVFLLLIVIFISYIAINVDQTFTDED